MCVYIALHTQSAWQKVVLTYISSACVCEQQTGLRVTLCQAAAAAAGLPLSSYITSTLPPLYVQHRAAQTDQLWCTSVFRVACSPGFSSLTSWEDGFSAVKKTKQASLCSEWIQYSLLPSLVTRSCNPNSNTVWLSSQNYLTQSYQVLSYGGWKSRKGGGYLFVGWVQWESLRLRENKMFPAPHLRLHVDKTKELELKEWTDGHLDLICNAVPRWRSNTEALSQCLLIKQRECWSDVLLLEGFRSFTWVNHHK